MGCVCSTFASVFMWTGELLENLLLAIADIGVVLIRGVIAVLVSLCDLLASCACCYRVPWDERPDRDTYTYSTVMKASAAQQHRRGPFWWATKQGRMEVKQEKAARKRQRQLEIEELREARRAAKEQEGKSSKAGQGNKDVEAPAARDTEAAAGSQ